MTEATASRQSCASGQQARTAGRSCPAPCLLAELVTLWPKLAELERALVVDIVRALSAPRPGRQDDVQQQGREKALDGTLNRGNLNQTPRP